MVTTLVARIGKWSNFMSSFADEGCSSDMWEFAKELMDLVSLLFILGAILLVFGLIGGGLTIKELRVPEISNLSRSLCVVIGLGSIAASIFVHVSPLKSLAPTDSREGAFEPHDTGVEYYRVCYVEPDDPDGGLVVREGPGKSLRGKFNSKTGVIPYDGRRVKYLKVRSLVGQTYWFKMRNSDTTGWVSSRYLCPDDSDCDCR